MGIVQGARRMTAPWHDDARSSAIPISITSRTSASRRRVAPSAHDSNGASTQEPHFRPHIQKLFQNVIFLFTFYSLLHTILYMLHNQHRLLLSAGFS